MGVALIVAGPLIVATVGRLRWFSAFGVAVQLAGVLVLGHDLLAVFTV